MGEKELTSLIIDSDFKKLIRPLYKKEYEKLEASLLECGCIDPIVTWNGIIVDGHNRYQICHSHGIPFAIIKKRFETKNDVVAWICREQLKRQDITEETRKYLIGKQYLSERAANSSSGKHENVDNNELPYETYRKTREKNPSNYAIGRRIAQENHIVWGTVYKYTNYAIAMDEISKIAPVFFNRILSGRYKISFDNIVSISKLEQDNVKQIAVNLEQERKESIRYRRPQHNVESQITGVSRTGQSVKDMPTFDPDGELTSLSLTIPSWVRSMERALEKTDFSSVTDSARRKLSEALTALKQTINKLLSELEEKNG